MSSISIMVLDNVFSTCLCVVDDVEENNNCLQNVLVFCKRLLFLSTPSTAHKQLVIRLLVLIFYHTSLSDVDHIFMKKL